MIAFIKRVYCKNCKHKHFSRCNYKAKISYDYEGDKHIDSNVYRSDKNKNLDCKDFKLSIGSFIENNIFVDDPFALSLRAIMIMACLFGIGIWLSLGYAFGNYLLS